MAEVTIGENGEKRVLPPGETAKGNLMMQIEAEDWERIFGKKDA